MDYLIVTILLCVGYKFYARFWIRRTVRLSFPVKPGEEIRQQLKDCGFKWHYKHKMWIAPRNRQTIKLAKELGFFKRDFVKTMFGEPAAILVWSLQRHEVDRG